MKPVADIVRDTVVRTKEAWRTLPHRGMLPAGIFETVDGQIGKVIAGTEL